MSGTQNGQGPQGQGPPQQSDPPYAPQTASLGGVPDGLPDIPATAVFLFLYVIFAVIHITIFKKNKARGHKFVFSGAMFGFCKIRIVTMSLRIAWACYRTNISLGIAAQIFVYVGTIILFIINWFFAQRIVRAQHPRWGWSQPYRIFHRGALVVLILCLLMLIVAAIQQFFTLNSNVHHIDRDLQLVGNAYFAAFCFAPIVVALISLMLPRRGTEKFGAGRLRNNITILLIAATVLSTGTIFRCITTWLTPVPLRTTEGNPVNTPWYFSKACFYIFNFTTEVFVVIFYAVTRVDLRFHVGDGSKGPGAYRASRDSKYFVPIIGNEKNLKRASSQSLNSQKPLKDLKDLKHSNHSSETLHEYQSSLFDDTRTLADSLRYPSSVLEVDQKTGNWKIKRVSRPGSVNTRMSQTSEPSVWSPDRDTYVNDNVPPVPKMPNDWPLRESQLPRGSVPVLEHKNPRSSSASFKIHDIDSHSMNRADIGDAIADAIAKLEANSEVNKKARSNVQKDRPPGYNAITPVGKSANAMPVRTANAPDSDIPRKHSYQPSAPSPATTPASDIPRKRSYQPIPIADSDLPPKRNHASNPPSGSDLPQKKNYAPISTPSSNLPQKRDYALTSHPPTSSERRSESESADSGSVDTAEREFRRFSFEAPPRRGEEGYQGGSSESERDLEGRGRHRSMW